MKNRLLQYLAIGALLFSAACGSDDCTQSDWLGTYTGTETCDGVAEDGDPFIITAGANDDELIVDGITFTFDGCSLSYVEEDEIFGSTFSVALNLELDGNTITGTSVVSIDGVVDESCSVNYSK